MGYREKKLREVAQHYLKGRERIEPIGGYTLQEIVSMAEKSNSLLEINKYIYFASDIAEWVDKNNDHLFESICYLVKPQNVIDALEESVKEEEDELKWFKEKLEKEFQICFSYKQEASKEKNDEEKIEVKNEEEWKKIIDKNNSSDYGRNAVEFAKEWACLMQCAIRKGKEVKNVAKDLSKKINIDITCFQFQWVTMLLIKYWKYGEELEEWDGK